MGNDTKYLSAFPTIKWKNRKRCVKNKIFLNTKMSATNYLNVRRRVIYQSERGAFYVQDGDKKVYGIKARFVKHGGHVKRLTSNHNPPSEIKPKLVRTARPSTARAKSSTIYNLSHPVFRTRKVRKDKGVARKVASAMSSIMSVLPNPYIRKTRKNAGVRRKMSMSPVYNLSHPVFRTRKTRKDAGMKRGPRPRYVGGVKPMRVHTRFSS